MAGNATTHRDINRYTLGPIKHAPSVNWDLYFTQ